jgi:ferrous iron transport protein A
MITSTFDMPSSQQAAQPILVALDSLPKSTRAEVVELPLGRGALHRLAELGIFVGSILHIERSAPLGGPVLVNVRGTLVALGRGLARRVQVRVLP